MTPSDVLWPAAPKTWGDAAFCLFVSWPCFVLLVLTMFGIVAAVGGFCIWVAAVICAGLQRLLGKKESPK